ncbi:hypothetical protein HW555_013702 [Spodoptera exigua]|uniref:DUF659 domain-containing protein n=1 Tax=Spodoptera exigua TaxID=7107 RepID=A0A835G2U9_SPOEX|nr:hypothetical protein HW555_013702 [Spodoptera exigua]
MIGDNASNMQKAFRLVKDVYPHITTLGCVAHTLNLLCKNIVKIEVINACKDMAMNMIKTIKNSQKEKNAGETLKLPCDTRWGSYYTSFKSLENTKVALQTLAVHEKATFLLAVEKYALFDDNFLNFIGQCKLIMEPISDAIFQLEGNEIYIHKMKTKKAMPWSTSMKWQRLGLNVVANLASHRAKDGFWNRRRFLWVDINDISAVTRWKGLCGSTALSKVAVRILRAPCTSAAVERSFSAHNDIPDDCVPDSPSIPICQSPEPCTSGLNRFEFFDCDQFDDDELQFWTSLSKSQFNSILRQTPSLRVRSDCSATVLGVYLVKIRTGESDERLASKFNMSRRTNLVKPFLVVCTYGYIIDVVGPNPATTSDVSILRHLLENVESPWHWCFETQKIFILDRGFRDSIPIIEECSTYATTICHHPEEEENN